MANTKKPRLNSESIISRNESNTEESERGTVMESGAVERLYELPTAALVTIMTKLDIPSLCSLAVTCRAFKSCVFQFFSLLPNLHILDISLPRQYIRPLLPPNPYLKSLKLDCDQLNDSSVELLLRPSLQELLLENCADFSGKLLSEIGSRCTDLRSLYLSSLAENSSQTIQISDLDGLLKGCTQLEALGLMFDVSVFDYRDFVSALGKASTKLTSLEIGYIPSSMVSGLRTLHHIQKLSLSVDYITDMMVTTISRGLILLTHLELRDAHHVKAKVPFDLTDSGLYEINRHGRLKHLSIVRSQEFIVTHFKQVSDLGILYMADKCTDMESICLGGFCCVTDSGFKALLHSCPSLHKLKVSHGSKLTDLVFHDIGATSLSLTHVSLRGCNLLTNDAIKSLVCNMGLEVLELRDCKSLGDEALQAISSLRKLKTLSLDGSDITDAGITYLKHGVISSLESLSVRGCKQLTDKCISSLFDGSCELELQKLNLSNLPNLSDDGVLTLALSGVPISELRLRHCPLIGDTSVMALSSMQVHNKRVLGSSLRLLDLYNCGGITRVSLQWLERPYFPKLRWLGLTGCVNRDLVDALARKRPFLHVACCGEHLVSDYGPSFINK